MEKYPEISVVMSVFNGEMYLRGAIESILNQTFADFEFIIFDDRSTDQSVSIIDSYQDNRIKLIKNTINKGLTLNLIDGLNRAKGKYIARMDADDICFQNRFEKQLDFMEKNPEISILGSSVIFFDETGREVIGKQPVLHEEIIIELLLGFTLLHPSVMMRTSDLKKYQLTYNDHFRYSQDFELWVRASRFLRLHNLIEPLLKMREHPFKVSRSLKPKQKAFSDEIRLSQLKELRINFSKNELFAFNKLGNSDSSFTLPELKSLESVLSKIEYANGQFKIFQKQLLREKISFKIREICYQMLLEKNKNGLYFFQSRYKWNQFCDIRFTSKFIFRSLNAILQNA